MSTRCSGQKSWGDAPGGRGGGREIRWAGVLYPWVMPVLASLSETKDCRLDSWPGHRIIKWYSPVTIQDTTVRLRFLSLFPKYMVEGDGRLLTPMQEGYRQYPLLNALENGAFAHIAAFAVVCS